MIHDLQKASLWKRIAAWTFDSILVGVIAVGLAFLLSGVLDYDSHIAQVEAGYEAYEAEYGTSFDISAEDYEALSDEQKQRYDAAYKALLADEDVIYAYNMVINLTLVITTGSLLVAILLLEFVIPAILGNGQTLGKKIMSLGVMRTDSVQLTRLQLLVRTLLGKFTVETMIPVYIAILILLGAADALSLGILAALLLAQLIVPMASRNRSQIHDLLAGTVVVDISSQMIFRSTEDLIAYRKKLAAEEAARKPY